MWRVALDLEHRRQGSGHLWFVLSTVRQAGSTVAAAAALDVPGQRPGTDGRGPPPQCPVLAPVGAPTAVDMFLASFPPVRGLVFQAAPLGACRGSREVGVLLAQAASVQLRRHQVPSSPASVALARRPLHARCAVLHDLDTAVSGQFCRGHWPIAQARLRLSRLELIASSGAPEVQMHRRPLRVCCARIHFANRLRAGAGRRSRSGRRPGRVRWGRPLQGSGSTSESAAGSIRLRGCGC